MREYFIYLAARLLVLLAAVAAVWAISGGFNLVGLILAVIISALVSYLLLGRLRTAATDAMVARSEAKARSRAQSGPHKNTDESAEDALLEQQLGKDGDQQLRKDTDADQ